MDNNLSYADFAAMSGNNGVNGMWNNPFMYLIWLAWFGGGNGFGFGGNRAGVAAGDVQAANNAAAIQNLSVMIQEMPSEAEEMVMKLDAIRWHNYLTPKEAERIVSSMQPKAPWSREAWSNTMQKMGISMEEQPYYNRCALWAEMNKQHSDSAETIAIIKGKELQDVSEDEMIKATFHLALDMLTDEDKVYNIRRYFNV